MNDLVRDSVFGHFLRFITGWKFFQYEEEKDPTLWHRYADKEESSNMAHHGSLEPAEATKEATEEVQRTSAPHSNGQGTDPTEGNDQEEPMPSTSQNGSNTRASGTDQRINEFSGVPIDPEKGRDATIITWFSEADPEVRALVVS